LKPTKESNKLRSSPGVERLLQTLTRHGTLESEGSFTVSLNQARSKTARYESSDLARYLLFFVSSGIGSGAGSIHIREDGASYVIEMNGGYIKEEALLSSLADGLKTGDHAPFDMAVAIRGALAFGADSVRVIVTHPSLVSYIWTLTDQDEESAQLPSAPAAISVRLSFIESPFEGARRFLRTLRGYVGQRAEFKHLERFADRSQVPLLVNGQSICRPLHLVPAHHYVQVGEVDRVRCLGSPEKVPENFQWSACLAFKPGRIELIARGISYSGWVESDDFSGYVYHDELNLDLSREGFVEDEVCRRFLAELETLRLAVLNRKAVELADWREATPWFLESVYSECVSGKLNPSSLLAFHSWLAARLGEPIDVEEKESDELIFSCLLIIDQLKERSVFREADMPSKALVARCVQILADRQFDQAHFVLRAIEVLEKIAYHQARVRNYLSLGLTALSNLDDQTEQALPPRNTQGSVKSLWGRNEDETLQISVKALRAFLGR
jgi:hypothetical protein